MYRRRLRNRCRYRFRRRCRYRLRRGCFRCGRRLRGGRHSRLCRCRARRRSGGLHGLDRCGRHAVLHRSLQSRQALVDSVRVCLQLWLAQANKGHLHLNPRGGAALDLYQSRLKQVQPTENLSQGKLSGTLLNMLVFVIGADD